MSILLIGIIFQFDRLNKNRFTFKDLKNSITAYHSIKSSTTSSSQPQTIHQRGKKIFLAGQCLLYNLKFFDVELKDRIS